MMRRFTFVALALLGCFNLAVGYKILTGNASAESSESEYSNLTIFTRALQLVRQDYVDENKVAIKDLTYSALRGMLNSLDPHSQFMEPLDFRDMQDDTRSEFGGLDNRLYQRGDNHRGHSDGRHSRFPGWDHARR
jgi:carboxyl-terminal processing protease